MVFFGFILVVLVGGIFSYICYMIGRDDMKDAILLELNTNKTIVDKASLIKSIEEVSV